jgi:hypothetical protein
MLIHNGWYVHWWKIKLQWNIKIDADLNNQCTELVKSRVSCGSRIFQIPTVKYAKLIINCVQKNTG